MVLLGMKIPDRPEWVKKHFFHIHIIPNMVLEPLGQFYEFSVKKFFFTENRTRSFAYRANVLPHTPMKIFT